MIVDVVWATDGYSVEELGLPTSVNMPTLSEYDIADYLSDKYGYLVESFTITNLDSGSWHGADAWVIYDDGHHMYILVGGYSLDDALSVKELSDEDWDTSEYDNDLVWVDAEEWVKQQEC
jgi:hypothetical protein